METFNIDMRNVAERILNDNSVSIQPNGDPIEITKETRLHRFAAFILGGGEMVEPDKVHIVVDGSGGFTATLDPDTANEVKRDGHLSKFREDHADLPTLDFCDPDTQDESRLACNSGT